MWPWEHVAFGYLAYSTGRRALGLGPPTDAAALALAVGAAFPDLVDKPLSWGLAVFPTGYAVAHSAFVAPAVVAAAVALGRRAGRPEAGAAFAVGHLSHLVGDVAYPAAMGEGLDLAPVLWPAVTLPAYETRRGLVGRFGHYLASYLHEVADGAGAAVVFPLALGLAVGALWLADGAPGVRWLAARAGR